MKALSVRQPWAHLIVTGLKTIENRSWRTAYRGPLLIHAGASRDSLGDAGDDEPLESLLTFGAIIGRVDLIDCVPFDLLPPHVREDPFASGPWCWILARPAPITPPRSCKGQVGLFTYHI